MKLRIALLTLMIAITGSSFAQEDMPKFGKDSLKCIEKLSLYAEYYKQKNYVDALPHWRYVFFNCPKSRKSIYIRGEKIFMTMANDAETPEAKKAYADSLQMILAQRIQYFGEEGYVKGKMGLFMYKYKNADLERINKVLGQSIDKMKAESNPNVLYTKFLVIAKLYNDKKRTKEDVINSYDEISTYIDQIIAKGGDNVKKGETAKSNIEKIFGPFANCEDLGNIYGPKVKENPNDTVLLKKVIGLLSKKECYDVPFYLDAVVKLHEAGPKPGYATAIGKLYYKKGDVSTSMKYMKEAVDLEKSDEEKAKLNLDIAKIYFKDLKDYGSARSFARKAAGQNPKWGEPYILIGDIYVSSANSCDDQKDKWAVYWAAADKYGRAKSIDANFSEIATKKINKYSTYYPEKGEAFFHGLNAGDSYTITCWLGETTTVRVK